LFSLDAGTGVYKFGNNTYPQRIRRRSNLGHIFQGKKVHLMGQEIRYIGSDLYVQAGLILHQGYVPEKVTQIEHKIPI